MAEPRRGPGRGRALRRVGPLGLIGPLGPLLLLALLAACRPPEPALLPVYADLVLDGSLSRGEWTAGANGDLSEVGPPSRVACADETRFAVELPAGASIRLPLTLGAEPRLLVSACSVEAPATLTLTVEGTGGLASEARLELPGLPDGTGWSERSIDLTSQSGGRAMLQLRVDGEASVYVSDLAIRHLLTADALDRDRGGVGRGGEPDRAAARGRGEGRGLGERLRSLLGGGGAGTGRRVLLISIDTLREDALGGGTASATPSLDAFAREAESWSPHYAAASWTKPSHASLLTGLPPAVHGADSIEGAMIPGARTLAQRFAAAGARTVGLVRDCEWLDPVFGFDRGFESYRVVPWQASQEVRVAETWLVTHRGEDAFFFLHLFTPHSDTWKLPYEAAGLTRAEVEARWGVADYGCRAGHCASELLKALNAGLAPLPDEAEILHALYRRGISDVDRALGTLFDDLRQAGLWDELTVVVTSDHGEAFFEHGQVLHTTVNQEIVRVPLMIKWPEGADAGVRHQTPTSALDVAPTLLAAAGLPTDGLPEPTLAARRADRPIFSGTTRRAVVSGPWKAIFDLTGATAGRATLYRLDDDPGELHDLAASRPQELDRLRALLDAEISRERTVHDALIEAAGRSSAPELSDEERRRLESLGYLN